MTNTGQLSRVDVTPFRDLRPMNAVKPLARGTVEYLPPWDDVLPGEGVQDGRTGVRLSSPHPGAGQELPGLVVELPHRLTPGGRKPKPLRFEVWAGKYTAFRYGS